MGGLEDGFLRDRPIEIREVFARVERVAPGQQFLDAAQGLRYPLPVTMPADHQRALIRKSGRRYDFPARLRSEMPRIALEGRRRLLGVLRGFAVAGAAGDSQLGHLGLESAARKFQVRFGLGVMGKEAVWVPL